MFRNATFMYGPRKTFLASLVMYTYKYYFDQRSVKVKSTGEPVSEKEKTFNCGSPQSSSHLLQTASSISELTTSTQIMPGEDEPVSMELDLGEPSSKLLEYAKKELGENPDTRAQVIQEFRDFIFEKGEVLPHRTDDAFLLRFLRARYFQVRRAHRLLVNYYTFKESNPQIHNNVNPLKMGFIGDDDILTVLPYRDQTGRRLLIYRIGNWDPSKYSAEEIFKATVIVLELGILEERAQILGGVCVFDLEGLSLQHAWNVTPSVASKITELMVTSFPMKIHAVHIINQSWVFDMVFGVFRHMLDERMLEKIFIHGSNLEALHTHVNPKSLPEKYGGTRPEYSYREWLDTLKVNPKIVEEMSSLGYIIDQHDTESYY